MQQLIYRGIKYGETRSTVTFVKPQITHPQSYIVKYRGIPIPLNQPQKRICKTQITAKYRGIPYIVIV
jgi:hypothetical protein